LLQLDTTPVGLTEWTLLQARSAINSENDLSQNQNSFEHDRAMYWSAELSHPVVMTGSDPALPAESPMRARVAARENEQIDNTNTGS